MNAVTRRILFWSPRVFTLLFAGFITLFAADAFEGQPDLAHRILSLAMHLVPTAIVVVVLVLAWRWEWVGALVYLGLALYYTLTTLSHPTWILAIAGPAYVIGLLFAAGWFGRKQIHLGT